MGLELESYGIEAVAPSSRTRGWFVLFAMYAGINICLPMLMMGGVLVPGISFAEALLVGILGNTLAALFICLGSYPGTDHGLPASVVTRMSLGNPWGTRLASLAIVFSMVGWFAVQAELAGLAADGVIQTLSSYSAPVLMIGLMGALNILFAVMGYGWIQYLASWSVPALLVLAALLFGKVAAAYPFRELVTRPGDGSLTFLLGMNIMVSGQIAAAFTSSDISRYAKNHRSVWYGIVIGVVPVATFMIALGALSRLASGEWNPVLGVRELGLGVPALALIIFATWTTNDKNIYSGGLALTNIFPGVSRWLHTLVLGALGTALGCFRLTRYFTEWLVTLGAVFAPLVGIILADYFFVCRRRPVTEELYREDGVYRYTRGVNVIALFAVALGVIVGRLTPPSFLQPIASLAVTALCYILGMRFMNRMILPK